MKISTYFVFLLMPLWVNAQNLPELDQQQIQAMMQNAQQMQACMQNIDQTELKAFERQGQQLNTDIETLCSTGKREEAQAKAISFAEDFIKSNAMIEMKKCTETMHDIVPDLTQMMQIQMDDFSEIHVCDN